VDKAKEPRPRAGARVVSGLRRRAWRTRVRGHHCRPEARFGTSHPALDGRVGPAAGKDNCGKSIRVNAGSRRRCRRCRRLELGEMRGTAISRRPRQADLHPDGRARWSREPDGEEGAGERARRGLLGSGRRCSSGGPPEEIWAAAALTRLGRVHESPSPEAPTHPLCPF
jgi:hypothetical protein